MPIPLSTNLLQYQLKYQLPLIPSPSLTLSVELSLSLRVVFLQPGELVMELHPGVPVSLTPPLHLLTQLADLLQHGATVGGSHLTHRQTGVLLLKVEGESEKNRKWGKKSGETERKLKWAKSKRVRKLDSGVSDIIRLMEEAETT